MTDTTPRLGLVGLGIMGRPMGRNLLKAGYELIVHDVNRAAVSELVAEGARPAESSREVAAGCDTLITMLPDSPEVHDAYLATDGAFEALRPGWLAIDMSSIAPRVARDLAVRAEAAGAEMLDAPVSGGDKGAIAGTLSIMVGGPEDTSARAKPIFEALGKTIVHVGPAGAGQVVKVCNQVVVAVVIEAIAEGLVLGSKSGVEPDRILDVLQGGLAMTKVGEMRRRNFLEGHFEPGFRTRLHLKNLQRARPRPRDRGDAAGDGPSRAADGRDAGCRARRPRSLRADHHYRGPRRAQGGRTRIVIEARL